MIINSLDYHLSAINYHPKSSFFLKKLLYQRATLIFHDAQFDLCFWMQHFFAKPHEPTFVIARCKHQSFQLRPSQGSRAHRTRLKGDV